MSSGFLSAAAPVTGSACAGLRPDASVKLFAVKGSVGLRAKTVSNGSRAHCMKGWFPQMVATLMGLYYPEEKQHEHITLTVSVCMTWNPVNNKKYETFSYLPPLSEESIAKEVDYMISKGWIPCLEFDEVGAVHRTNSQIPGYYDGRYWTLWKLPMFGCSDSSQVLNEIQECRKAYPKAYIRLLSFDNQRQCQCMSFLIQKPTSTDA